MKLIHLISGGDVGGAKTHVLSLLQTLCKENEVLLVCFMEGDFADEARSLGIPTRVLPSWNLPKVCGELKKLIVQGKFQIVHCHGSRANLIGAKLRNRISAPVVTTIHSDPKLDYLGRPLARLVYGTGNGWALRHLRYRQGVSGPTCQMLISRGFSPQTTFEISNGVDFENVHADMSRAEFCSSIGLTTEENSVIFGIAARINPVKDMKTLVRGFAKAAEKTPEIRLVIAGDGEERQAVEELAWGLGLQGKVVFAGWLQDTGSFYSAIDVNMLTSLSEGFPYAIPEGARFGCATISTNVGGIPQVLRHEENALLLKPGDVDTLADHMVRLARDEELRQRLGSALHDFMEAEYSLEAMGKRQVGIYETILALEQRRKLPRDGVIISGAYGRGNTGDDMILKSIVSQLRAKDPLLPICVLSRRPLDTAMQFGTESIRRFHLTELHRRMTRAKLLISGGGSLVQDVTSTRSLWYYLQVISLGHTLGCKVMMYGCGVGPVCRKKNRRLAGRILRNCVDYATLRDPMSAEELQALGAGEIPHQVTADPALSQETGAVDMTEYRALAGMEAGKRYCLFALRLWHLTGKQISALAAAADYAYKRYALIPAFFLMEPRKDAAATKAVVAKVQSPCLILPTLEDQEKITALLREMELVVSMRLHALILATGQGAPTVGISYDPKVQNYMDYVGQECCLPVEKLSDGALCDMVDAALSSPGTAKEIMGRMKALAMKNSEIAWSILSGSD